MSAADSWNITLSSSFRHLFILGKQKVSAHVARGKKKKIYTTTETFPSVNKTLRGSSELNRLCGSRIKPRFSIYPGLFSFSSMGRGISERRFQAALGNNMNPTKFTPCVRSGRTDLHSARGKSSRVHLEPIRPAFLPVWILRSFPSFKCATSRL